MSDTTLNLPARLRQHKRGHPYAKIPWPHSILEEAAVRLEELEAEISRLQLDAHTKDAFYGAAISERDATIARLREWLIAGRSKVDMSDPDVHHKMKTEPVSISYKIDDVGENSSNDRLLEWANIIRSYRFDKYHHLAAGIFGCLLGTMKSLSLFFGQHIQN
jgi:hypothetical protein